MSVDWLYPQHLYMTWWDGMKWFAQQESLWFDSQSEWVHALSAFWKPELKGWNNENDADDDDEVEFFQFVLTHQDISRLHMKQRWSVYLGMWLWWHFQCRDIFSSYHLRHQKDVERDDMTWRRTRLSPLFIYLPVTHQHTYSTAHTRIVLFHSRQLLLHVNWGRSTDWSCHRGWDAAGNISYCCVSLSQMPSHICLKIHRNRA